MSNRTQVTKLVRLMKVVSSSGKVVRYGDLIRRGFNKHNINKVVTHLYLGITLDTQGYTVITNKIRKGGVIDERI